MQGCGRAVVIGLVGLGAIVLACLGLASHNQSMMQPPAPPPREAPPEARSLVTEDHQLVRVGDAEIRLATAVVAPIRDADGRRSTNEFFIVRFVMKGAVGGAKYTRFAQHGAELIEADGTRTPAIPFADDVPAGDEAGNLSTLESRVALLHFPASGPRGRVVVRVPHAAVGGQGFTEFAAERTE